jgi:hypothetical protein
MTAAAAAVNVPPLLIPPPGYKNCCGQAAVASVVEVMGKNTFKGSDKLMELFKYVYKWYPPDILWGSLGTSAQRIVSALKAFGLKKTISLQLEPWIFGGFSNPANVIAYKAYSKMVFSYVNAGYPAIIMVDNGKLGDDWHIYHWPVLYKASNIEAFLCNAVDKVRSSHYRRVDHINFCQAWEAPALAIYGFRFNAVIAIP